MDHARRRNPDELIRALRDAGAHVKGRTVRCLWHNDKHASAGIFRTEQGAWKYRCQVCDWSGDIFDVESRIMGVPLAQTLNEGAPTPKVESYSEPKKPEWPSLEAIEQRIPKWTHRFLYCDTDTGKADLAVYRISTDDGGKRFMQASPVADGRWVMSSPPKPWPLYNRSRVRDAEQVVVVEGEKAVHALHAVGVVATTSPCGAGAAKHADWTPLAGKQVVLWADNDDAGQRHMDAVRELLERLDPPPELSMVDVDALGLDEKGDAWDYVMGGGSTPLPDASELVWKAIYGGRRLNPSSEVRKRILQTISGERANIPWPWPMLTHLTQALLPSTITLLCGEPGAGKSFWLLQCMAWWHKQSLPVALMELEEDKEYYLHRSLAQESGIHGLLSDEWMRENGQLALECYEQQKDYLDGFSSRLWSRGRKQFTLLELAAWAEERAKEGARVIAIDPITVAETSAARYVDDAAFMSAIEHVVKTYETAVILVTHPSRGGGKGHNAANWQLAGSEAYPRSSRTILWLKPFKEGQLLVRSADVGPAYDQTLNMIVAIIKARNGPGGGRKLAYMSTEHMTFMERGEIEE